MYQIFANKVSSTTFAASIPTKHNCSTPLSGNLLQEDPKFTPKAVNKEWKCE
jgi:hypothetical protein